MLITYIGIFKTISADNCFRSPADTAQHSTQYAQSKIRHFTLTRGIPEEDHSTYAECQTSQLDKTHFFFQENIGRPLDCALQNENWCGAGRMLAIDAQGNFYPCTRFAQYSLRDKPAIIIGNIKGGINTNKLRPFLALDRCTQSTQECINCEVAEGCAWCQGENYDAAETNTIYQRSTAICKMHKARVRANNYYWNRLNYKLELGNF